MHLLLSHCDVYEAETKKGPSCSLPFFKWFAVTSYSLVEAQPKICLHQTKLRDFYTLWFVDFIASLYPKVKMTFCPKAVFTKVFIKFQFLYDTYMCVLFFLRWLSHRWAWHSPTQHFSHVLRFNTKLLVIEAIEHKLPRHIQPKRNNYLCCYVVNSEPWTQKIKETSINVDLSFQISAGNESSYLRFAA